MTPQKGRWDARAIRIAVALFCALPFESLAQVPDIAPGTRVRVEVRGDSGSPRVVGRAMKVDSQKVELAVSDNGSVAEIPWSHISRFGWSIGKDQGAGARRALLVSIPTGVVVYLFGHEQARRNRGAGRVTLTDLNEGAARLGAIVATSLTFLTVSAFATPEAWRDANRPEPAGASAGVRLRLVPTDEFRARTLTRTVTGRPLSSEGDTLVLVSGTVNTALAWQNVTSLSVRGGKDRKRGVLYGVGISTAIAIIGILTDPVPASETADVYIGNAIIGGILGAIFAPRGWIPLPVANR